MTIRILIMLLSLTAVAPLAAQSSPELWLKKGMLALSTGDYGRAADALKHALVGLSSDDVRYVDTSIRLAESYKALGLHGRALPVLQKALAAKPTENRALLLSALIDVYLSLGQTDDANAFLQEAVVEAQAVGDPYLFSSVLNEVSNIMIAEQNFDEAIGVYDKCLALLADAPQDDAVRLLRLTVRLNLARVLAMAGDLAEASAVVQPLAVDMLAAEEGHYTLSLLLGLGALLEQVPEITNVAISPTFYQTAEHVLGAAVRLAEQQQDARMLSQAYGQQGQYYARIEDLDKAQTLTRKAIFHARQGDHPELLYRWLWQMGRLQATEGYLDEAIYFYQLATEVLQPIRNQLFSGYRRDRSFFSRMIRPVYLELAGLLLEKISVKRGRKESDDDLLLAARDQLESLKSAELEDFFQDSCATAAQANIKTLEQMPDKTALLYPIALEDRLMLLLTLPDGLHYRVVEVGTKQVNNRARELRVGLQDRGSGAFFEPARDLYDWLIKPMEGLLEKYAIDTLVVAPDSALRLIPFSTLHSGKEFLIERVAIATVPGISMTDSSNVDLSDSDVLLSGLSDAVQGFSALPNVPTELQDIQGIMQTDKVLQNQKLTVDELTQAITAKGYPIVHMATHGVFGGSAEDTFLLTYDGRLDMNRLTDLINVGRFRDQPVELLTLSACQTALGDERAALGLAGVAVKAGVRSVIATLWFVDDEATSETIRDFYRRLKASGVSKAQALQQAQKALLAQTRFRHPAYWGPFLLIGSWR